MSMQIISLPEVEHRLLRACKTLRALPDRERRFQVVQSLWPATADDPDMAYAYNDVKMPKFRPSPRDVSDCLVALGWLKGLEKSEFRFLWWRSFGLSFGRMADFIGRSDESARQRYRDVLMHGWRVANSDFILSGKRRLDILVPIGIKAANHPKMRVRAPHFRSGRILHARVDAT